MVLERTHKKPLYTAAIIALLVMASMLFSACASLTVNIDTKSNIVETIEPELLPLTAPKSTALAEAVFENGSDVDTSSVGSKGSVTLNYNLGDKGIIGLKADILTEKRLKAKISKGAGESYYNITPFKMVRLPLLYGGGSYKVEVYENLQDTQYRQVFEKQIDVQISDENSVFLYSNQVVNFDGATKSATLSAALTADASDDWAKLNAIYQYVITHIAYDYEKINGLDNAYIPDADAILQSGSGICYDYAAVMAVMLREAGIPAKLVKGYRSGLTEYHAWNEAFVNGKWVVIDATFDAAALRNHEPYEMVKDSAQYYAEKVY